LNKINEYLFSALYDISSGISTTKAQAGNGSPFVSFSTVFNNYFLPDELPDLMDTSESEQDTYSVKEGDILLTRTSETVDELAMSSVATKDYPCTTFSGFTKRLRPLAKGIAYHKYLGFYLRGYLFRKAVTNHSIMALRASFNEEIFALLKLYLPEYEQQVKIGDFLYSFEQKTQVNIAIYTKLEKAMKLLYDYWFMQFDFPNVDGKPYRASGGTMEYNEQLKREIPKSWKVQKLNTTSLCTLMSSGIDRFDGDKIYLSTSEVDGVEIVNHSVTTDYANRLQRANMQPRLNSVWFAKMKDTVKNILVNEGAEVLASDYIFSTGFAGLQCTPTSLYYVWNYLRGDYFENKKNLVATGATQQAINDDDLKDFDILVPPAPLIELFHKTVAPYYHMISRSKFENKELAALRDFLLPLLMNGQVTVAASEN
jgi:type I restriction enzyme S subunit